MGGGINKKPDYTLKDVEIIVHRRKLGNYQTGKNKPILPNWDYAMCAWGSVGKVSNFIGEYAEEIYVYVHNKVFLEQVLSLLEYEKINTYAKSMSVNKISRMKLYKYLKENIKGIR